MKFIILILFFSISQMFSYAQFSYGPDYDSDREFVKGFIDQVVKAKTLFILSDTYTKEEYITIIEKVWSVTDYEVVNIKDYNPSNIIENTNVITFSMSVIYGSNISYGQKYVFLKMVYYDIDGHEEAKEKAKMKNKMPKDLSYFIKDISKIRLFQNKTFDEFPLRTKEERDLAMYSLYVKPMFNDFTLGFFKNYMQKLNSLLEKRAKFYWRDARGEFTSEVKNLTEETLYIPQFILDKFDQTEDEMMKKSFKKYPYQIRIISNNELEKKIMDNEKIYYLLFNQNNIMNTRKYWRIVNSKTGEIIFRDFSKRTVDLAMKPFCLIPKEVSAIVKVIKK